MSKFKDYFGRKIKKGDLIVYPGRQGSCMWMNDGIVLSKHAVKNYRGYEDYVIKVRANQYNVMRDLVGTCDVTVRVLSRVVIVKRKEEQ
jgi:hypothetical protein